MPQLSLDFAADDLEKLWGAESRDARRERIIEARRAAIEASWDDDTRYERMATHQTVRRSRLRETEF